MLAEKPAFFESSFLPFLLFALAFSLASALAAAAAGSGAAFLSSFSSAMAHFPSIAFLHFLQTRTFFSPSTVTPTRVGLSQLGHTREMDESEMLPALSTMPPS